MPYKDKEKRRQSDKRYYQRHHEKLLRKQRAYNRNYYQQNRERILEHRKLRMRTDKQYHEQRKERTRISYRKAAEAWGTQQGHRAARENIEIATRTELFVAQFVLPKYGFTNIIVCRTFARQFPFDILAKKDGRRVAVEVTIGMQKSIKPQKKLLLDFMDADLYICHVKLDFSRYYLLPVNMEEKTSSTCQGIFMKTIGAKNVVFKKEVEG